MKDLANIYQESRFHGLPAPFGFKESPGALCEFQLAAIPLPEREGQSYLVKHITRLTGLALWRMSRCPLAGAELQKR